MGEGKRQGNVFGIVIEEEAVSRERRGFHQLVFDDKTKVIDGEEVTMMNQGWDAITRVYGTKTPAILIPRLVALHIGLVKGKLKILPIKEYEELVAQQPKKQPSKAEQG